MRFSQTQVRDTIGISVETFRHWKRVFPPFSGRKKYTLGDLLAAGVLHRLTDHCGVGARHLPEISKLIVGACNTTVWASLQGKTLVIDVHNKTCILVKNTGVVTFNDMVVICPMGNIIAQIQETLLRKEPEVAQHCLRFPPIAVSRRQRA